MARLLFTLDTGDVNTSWQQSVDDTTMICVRSRVGVNIKGGMKVPASQVVVSDKICFECLHGMKCGTYPARSVTQIDNV